MTTILELVHGVRRYGQGETAITALDDVTLSVDAGDWLAVVGPSGSGKTTLLSVLGLIDQLDDGDLRLHGRSVGSGEDERTVLRRKHIGFVFQLFHLIPALSARDNIGLPLVPFMPDREIGDRANHLLGRLGLADRATHLPSQLSGGEQQRVAIARALIAKPDVVLADEPTGNLDSRTAASVFDVLLSLQADLKFALVVATHDEALADRLGARLVLADGRVMAPPRGRP